MVGYWPSFYLCVFIDRDGVKVYKLLKEQGDHPAILTEQASSIKNYYKGFGE